MAPDFDSLMLMQACRRLYKPADKKLTTAETLELTRRFLNGYLLFKNEPQVVALANEVRAYNTMLRNYGIRDHQVKNTGKSRLHAFGLLLWREFILLLFTITLIPGAILNFPAWIVITWIASKKQKEALAGSSVKISAKDVVATWKLMVSLVFLPILYLVEAIVLTLCLVYFTTVTTIVSPWALFFSFYAIIPVISIFSIYAGERAIDIIKSIRPLLVSLFQSQESIMLLESSRMNLEKKLAELVDVLGPKMYHDFEKTRMIKISDEDVVESGDESQTEGYFYDARIEKRRGKKNQED